MRLLVRAVASLILVPLATGADADQPRPDPGKKACAAEARKLCPAEMRSMSRRKVEACMIAHIDQTSESCHAAMLRIKAEREAAGKP